MSLPPLTAPTQVGREFIVRSIHTYQTSHSGHLSFAPLQFIRVLHCENSGWWLGECDENVGWFPSNHVERVPEEFEGEVISRPTSISSEDYARIRSGLDGVETQFLGNSSLETRLRSALGGWRTSSATSTSSLSQYPSIASQPGPFSSQPYLDLPQLKHDFVDEIVSHIQELQDAIQSGSTHQYQQIVADIISCIKVMFISTNTLARDSSVLQRHPDLARLRRGILRALGRMCAKCRIANGTQSLTVDNPSIASRQRQVATEKLRVFGLQILTRTTDFMMRIKQVDYNPQGDDLETSIAPTQAMGSGANMSLRPRRRVSRANSAKGFISFKPARSAKTDISQKYLVAKSAIEHAFTDYMECLNRGIESMDMDRLLRIAFQASEPVAMFLTSIEDMSKGVSTHQQWDVKELTAFCAQLATTLNDLFGVIQDIKGDLQNPSTAQNYPVEGVLTKLMAFTSDLLRSLVDMERLFITPTPVTAQPRPQSSSEASGTSCTMISTVVGSEQDEQRSRNASEWRPSEFAVTRFTDGAALNEPSSPDTMPRSEAPATPACNVMALSRKFVSLNAINSHYKSQAPPMIRSESLPTDSGHGASYGDAYDFNSHASVSWRQGHDSAVALMSESSTPHHSIMSGHHVYHKLLSRGATIVIEEEEIVEMDVNQDSTVEQDLQPQQDPLKTRPALDGTQRRSSTMTVDILEPKSNHNKAIPWAEQLQHDLDDVVCRKRRSTNASDTRLASRVKSDGRPPITIGSSSNGTFPRPSKAPPPRSDSVISNLSIAIESQQTNALPPLPPMLTSTTSPKPSSLPTTIGGVKPRPISPAMQFHSLRSQPLSPRPPQKRSSRPLSRQSIQGKENLGPLSELFRQSTISLSFSVRDSLHNKAHANSWFLGNDYHDDEAVFNENNQLTGATLGAYIELLTPHRTGADPSLVSTFFITFRLFSTPSEVVSLLIGRFNQKPPVGLDVRQSKLWIQKKQDRIRQSVYSALKTWIDNYWVTEKDSEALAALVAFAKGDLIKALPTQANRLLESLQIQMSSPGVKPHTLSKARSYDHINLIRTQDCSADHGAGFGRDRAKIAAESSSFNGAMSRSSSSNGISSRAGSFLGLRGTPPAPSVNKALLNALSNDRTIRSVPVTEIMPLELARQLTLYVGKMFLDIPYLELLTRDRPNCSKMAKTATEITTWIIETIVDQSDLKKRVEMIKYWIKVGEECLKLNNFDTLTAITCAIDSSPIHRLSATWEAMASDFCTRFQQLQQVVSTKYNYREYRAKLKSTEGPCVPFLGLFLTAVTHIADGNAASQELDMPCLDESKAASAMPKLIRYCRYHYLANTVQEFRRFQTRYELLLVPRLREYIVQCLQGQDWQRNIEKSNSIEPSVNGSGGKGVVARNNNVSRGSTFGFFGGANSTNKNRNRGMTIFRRKAPQTDAPQVSSANSEPLPTIKRTRKLDIFQPGPRK
ncbi:hypothetical protein MVEG_04392 [Podila verticillata NRRL 6337]|nr:hypothetical protein MVEG_04392 [Podila verticillata NRRL 6337]